MALPVLSSPRSSFCSGAMANVSVSDEPLSSSLPRMSLVRNQKRLAFGAPWPFRSGPLLRTTLQEEWLGQMIHLLLLASFSTWQHRGG